MRWPARIWPWLAAVGMLVGCTHQVPGDPQSAVAAEGLLPSEDELTEAIGNRLSSFGFQPFVGGLEIMPDGFRTDDDATPIRCVGVTDTMTRLTYEPSDVLEAARQSYFTWNEQVDVSGADAAIVRMATDGDAAATYERFAEQWRGCDDQTVTKHVRGSSGAEVAADISDVRTDDGLLSATVTTTQGTNSPPVHYERAVGVRGDTIAEVSLAVALGAGNGSPARTDDQQAVRAVEAMLAKVKPGT